MTTPPRIGSLCTGYGGLDTAVQEIFGGTVAWHADNDPGAARILTHHHPHTPNLGDLTAVDWHQIRRETMAAPRCDERAQEMYDRYCQGLSLAEVAAEYECARQNVYNLFKRRGWDLRPRPPARPAVTWQGQRYTLRNNGYFGCTTGGRELLHRDVWRHHFGEIPHGWDIHHRDHDKTNNDPSNLECLPKDEHARRYNLGCNGTQHKCGIEEVVPTDSPAIDVLTAGYPRGRASRSAPPASAKEPQMNATSGRTSPTPLAYYDPDTSCWKTSQGTFDEDSTPSSPILPASGSMSSGLVYARRRSALPTAANASSSSPLLKTPTAQLAVNGGSQHPDKRRAGGHGPTLADEVEHLLPTPTVADSRGTRNRHPDGTPYSPGYGATLTDAAMLLPTPRASDTGTPGRRASEGFRPPLSQVVLPLLPTPTASDGDRQSTTYGRGNPMPRGALTPRPSTAGSTPPDAPHPGQLTIEVG